MDNENLNEEQLQEAVTEITEEPEMTETAAPEEAVTEEIPVEETAAEEPAVEPAAEPEVKKGKRGGVILTVALILALAACLVVAVLAGTGVLFNGDNTETTIGDTTEPESTVDETTIPVDLKSWTVDDETAVANADKVVATIGDVQMTNGELQTCYQMAIYNFYSANQYYLSYMGVDFSKPLGDQAYNAAEGISWQGYLLDQAFQSWHLYTVLYLLGQEENFELDEEGQAYLTEMEESMKSTAQQQGYESVDAMLQVMVAPGATAAGYVNNMAVSDYAYRYYTKRMAELQPTTEELEQYFTENEATLAESGITKDAGNLVDVRHILIRPEGGTTAEDGTVTYSDEEWETCRQKAQDILDQWKAGDATEESFGALAKEHTADGNGDVGGLYENVTKGYMVEEFDSWIFDESRAYADTDLVKTQFGYHVMFFVGSQPSWEVYTAEQYVYEKIQEIVDAAYERWPMEIDYDAICLGEPNS